MRDAAEATVNIIHKYNCTSAGTGFFVSADGVILTCKHVIELGGYTFSQEERIRLWRQDTKEDDVGTINAVSDHLDLAIIQVSNYAGFTNPFLHIASTDQRIFEVSYIGYPFCAKELAEGTGKVPRFRKDTISVDEANSAGPGYSGGPLLLSNDTVIGVITLISKPDKYGRNKNYATAISSCAVFHEFGSLLFPNGNTIECKAVIDDTPDTVSYFASINHDNRVAHVRDENSDLTSAQWVDVYSFPRITASKDGPPIVDLLHYKNKLLVMSQSGYGKSQLVQGLSWLYSTYGSNMEGVQYANRHSELCNLFGIDERLTPVIIRGKDIRNSSSEKNLLDYAVYSVEKGRALSETDLSFVEQECSKGNAILLLDSFDEIELKKDKDYCLRLVHSFCNENNPKKVVITSRYCPEVLGFIKEGYQKVHICAFNDGLIHEQAKRRISNGNAEEAYDSIKRNSYLWDMAESPIMLTDMLMTIDKHGKPMSPVSYLERLTTRIIEQRWDTVAAILPTYDVRIVLGCVAWIHLLTESPSLKSNEIKNMFNKACRIISSKSVDYPLGWNPDLANADNKTKAAALYDELSVKSGILIFHGENTAFGFQNILIECYLASLFFVQMLSFCRESRTMAPEKIIYKIHNLLKDATFSKPVMDMLVMSFSALVPHQQKALLRYILLRGLFCNNNEELRIIVAGIKHLINRTLDDNSLLNDNSPELSFTRRWLNANDAFYR